MTARPGERPTSDYSAEEICYARALDWLRVDEQGFGYVLPEGVTAIEVVRKRAPFTSVRGSADDTQPMSVPVIVELESGELVTDDSEP